MFDTNLSVNDIQDAIILYYAKDDIRNNIIVPNVYWGLGIQYEADLVIANKSGYATEFEIKRSYSDFVADFNKSEKAHKGQWVYRFYYVLPLSIKDKVENFIEYANIEIPAILYYDENGNITKNDGISYRKGGRKMFLEEQLKLAKLGTMRYWALRNEENNLFKNKNTLKDEKKRI